MIGGAALALALTLGAAGWSESLLTVREAAAQAEPAAARGVEISGEVVTPKTFTLDELRHAPATVAPVYFSTGKGPV